MLAAAPASAAKVKPMKLSVLYLGGQSEWAHGEFDGPDHFKSEEDYQQAISRRQTAFEQLLRTYFTTVKAMPAADYKPEMSRDYDVTIFDGRIPVLREEKQSQFFQGQTYDYPVRYYLPEDFDRPCITIGTMGETLCRTIGIKNDWLCLCLDADAHGMNLEHPIFKGPFKTSLTLVKKPTPADAFHYAYFQDGHVPDSVMMWRVNTDGYVTNQEMQPGMVSRPWGYTDSPDCENISSGVCAKTLDAVALSRHANFFHWGFIGSPDMMTDEAKTVFANAVAYIAKHPGKPLVRKWNEHIATSEYLKEVRYYCTREAHEAYNKLNDESYAQMLAIADTARAKQARGEELSAAEKMYIGFTREQIPPQKTFAEWLQERHPDLFAQFGDDEGKYRQYFDENAPYFYGGSGSYALYIDADAKAWGIPVSDKRLIDRAITCLENGQETDRARRILRRYTLCEFQTPAEWRAWFDKYQPKMFFTESGGWLFMVNDPTAPGNDYSVQKRREKAAASTETTQGAPATPTHQNPLIVTARAKKADLGGVDVFVDIQLMAGYHIYRTVDETDPYIPLSITFDIPEGATLAKNFYPVAKPFTKLGTTIYESGTTTIHQNIAIPSLPATIKCRVECQCCDAHVCLPPLQKEFTFEIE